MKTDSEDVEYMSQIHLITMGRLDAHFQVEVELKQCVGLWTNYGLPKASFLISLVQKAAIRWKKCISSPIYCENNKMSGVYLNRGSLFT